VGAGLSRVGGHIDVFLLHISVAMILASADAVRNQGLIPRARILGTASAGVPPRLMGIGPVSAAPQLDLWRLQSFSAIAKSTYLKSSR
jgi:hypothetical protein